MTNAEKLQQMQANSQEWHTATPERKLELEEANRNLAKEVGGDYDPSTNKWKDSSGNDLYDYSNITGSTSNSSNVNSGTSTGGNLYDYSSITGGTTATKPTNATQTTYYDKQGNPYTGYIIDNKTYKDAEGTQRIDVGMLVPTANGQTWYEMTPTGGVQVNAPLWTNPEYLNLQAQIEALQSALFSVDTGALQGYQDLIQATYDKVANFKAREAMSQEEARARAEADVGGTYDEKTAQLINAYNQNAIQRGMFGQTPTEALKMEALAANELDRATNISSTASNIQAQDFNQKQILDQNDLDRYLAEANLGQTLYSTEMQEIQMEMENKINALNYYQQQQAEKYSKAMDRLNTLGYADAEVAAILGVPEGTKSSDQRVREAEAAIEKEMMQTQAEIDRETMAYQASLNAKYSSSGGGGGGGGGNGTGYGSEISWDDWNDALTQARTMLSTASKDEIAAFEAIGISLTTDDYGNIRWSSSDAEALAMHLYNLRFPEYQQQLANQAAQQQAAVDKQNLYNSFSGDNWIPTEVSDDQYTYYSPYHTYLDSTGTLRYNYQNGNSGGSAIDDKDKK